MVLGVLTLTDGRRFASLPKALLSFYSQLEVVGSFVLLM
jgi:hypothetical protein